MKDIVRKILRKLYLEYLDIRSLLVRQWFNINPNISIGRNTLIESNITFKTLIGRGTVTIGNNCELKKGCQFLSYGGKITIGNYCSVNPYTMIYGQGGVVIGNYVRIATHCVIIPSNHIFSSIDMPIFKQGLNNKGIVIEDDVWLGAGVVVLDGVRIAKGCIIGAGSVVNNDTEPYCIYVGSPARKIKTRH